MHADYHKYNSGKTVENMFIISRHSKMDFWLWYG
jgi:hypothetical protein